MKKLWIPLGVLASILGWIWLWPDITRQYRVMATGADLLLAIVVTALWVLIFSRWRWTRRLTAVLGLAALAVGARLSVKIVGVTGDLIPIVAWRWAAERHFEGTARREVKDALSRVDPLDYPRFLGPRGDATLPGVRLDRDWSTHPPREVWRRPVGAGWSSFAVVNGHAITQEQRGEDECVVCYVLSTGEPEWVHAEKSRFESTIGGDGPRATPTIAGGRVYAYGALGRLGCLDGGTGESIWSREVVTENGGRVPEWGKSCSPLVLGDRVIVSAGGNGSKSLIAYSSLSGEPAWQGGVGSSGYASPWPLKLAGVEQIVIFNSGNVRGHDPATGNVLWEFPWQHEHPNVMQPVLVGESSVLVSSGYGVGAALIEVKRDTAGAFSAAAKWQERGLKSKFSNVVIRGDHAFGLDDGILTCLSLENGQRAWKGGRYGHGQLLLVEDLILIQVESGELALVEADATAHHELGRVPALGDKSWNHPAFRPPYLLLRNHHEAVCFELGTVPF